MNSFWCAELPENPTQEQTIQLYRVGEGLEQAGRHCKRVAVAAEYLSGRDMREWCKLVGITENQKDQLVAEAKGMGLAPQVKPPKNLAARQKFEPIPEASQLSQSMPTRDAAREFAKSDPIVKEAITKPVMRHTGCQCSPDKDMRQIVGDKQ